MTNKKNRFFTLVFSCCPGAGEMYMGLYKHGISLMALFFGAFAAALWLNWEELVFLICPVVWCYSFFHTHNLRRMTEEAFAAVEDRFFFEGYVKYQPDWQFTEKHRRFFGLVLLLAGLSILWKVGMRLLETLFYVPEFFWRLGSSVPQIAMALLVLYAALRLMREPKEETEAETKAEELQMHEETQMSEEPQMSEETC